MITKKAPTTKRKAQTSGNGYLNLETFIERHTADVAAAVADKTQRDRREFLSTPAGKEGSLQGLNDSPIRFVNWFPSEIATNA